MKAFKYTALTLSVVMALGLAVSCADKTNVDGNENEDGGEQDLGGNTEIGEALGLSHESGVYGSAFDLKVTRADESHVIYYTLDGSAPTTSSKQLGAGLRITSTRTSYPLTDAVTHDPAEYGRYTFGKSEACTVLRLLETDASGEPVAEDTAYYFVRSGGAESFTVPVISLTLPEADAVSFYNDIKGEGKTRAEMAYFDFGNDEFFSLNTQIKVGGNWTKGFPYRTMNVNFNKNENGKKNTPVTADLFEGRAARNGSTLTDFTRFRLHSGGNAQVTSWFADGFAQRVAAEVGTESGEYLQLATTGYRPCEVYINGEYWGLYAIREHYSDVYFAQNYGVDKDEVLLLDRTHNIKAGDPAYADTTVFNTTYAFEVAEDNEAEDGSGMRIATDFFDYLMNTDFSIDANYAELATKMDLTGLADLVLTQLYVGNWDFMNNNIKMWRTDKTDESNPYADGKWRFCLHDLDFAFENQWGDVGLIGANGYALAVNYLDFYLGNAYNTMGANPVGTLSRELSCLLTSPMQNAQFRALLLERAEVVQEIYTNSAVKTILNDMEAEVSTAMQRHLTRWNRSGYSYLSWQGWVQTVRSTLDARIYMYDDSGRAYYPDGSYFLKQVNAAIDRFTSGRH